MLAGSSSGAAAPVQEASGEISVLFVGNSLTIQNDLPAMLDALLRSTGWDQVRVASLSQPGFGLEDHWRGGVARAAIRTGAWDVIVLQQGPSATEGRPSLLEYSSRFAKEARDAGARVGLYMVWPTKARRYDFDGVSESYSMAADAADGVLFPVGDAWREAWCRDRDLALYGPDAFHPSQAATYLAALVIYGRLTDSDVSGLPPDLELDSGYAPVLALDAETASAELLAVVTGANSGVGRSAAELLAAAGASVVMVCRSEERGRAALEAARKKDPDSRLRLEVADLSSLSSVRDVASRLRDRAGPIDLLVNNAGVYRARRELSEDGFEMTMA
ncbi:MAG: SDR family NAD(P)-dependent oxidoreductase, partial [Planctomycetota bacterium]